jgi:transcriptional regulator with XRE-family HTH domain
MLNLQLNIVFIGRMSYSKSMSPKRPDPVDITVGQRLRQRRLLAGQTQEQLAEAVGVTFQMVQKYEKGSCRVGASRLSQIARALNVPVAYFFDNGQSAKPSKVAEDTAHLNDDILSQKETIDLLKAYYALPEATRKHLLTMAKGLAPEGKKKSK